MPRDFQEQRSLVGYSPWGLKELDLTKRLTLSLFHFFFRKDKEKHKHIHENIKINNKFNKERKIRQLIENEA